MVIDSHEHIMFPTKIQLDRMDAAGVDKAILFCSAPHPEKAGNLNELETEMNALYKILAGANKKEDNMKRLEKNISEITTTVNEYPNRFWGFGSVPLGLGLEETQNWIDSQIIAHSLCGIGEFTPGNEQQILQLDVVFQAIRNTMIPSYFGVPLWAGTLVMVARPMTHLTVLLAVVPSDHIPASKENVAVCSPASVAGVTCTVQFSVSKLSH